MDRSALVLIFDHILEGHDIPTPEGMLKVKAEAAATQIEPAPYSLLTNLAHATLWQRFWLQKLAGGKRSSTMKEWKDDFRVPDAEEWEGLRREFLEGLKEARRIAASDPFDHQIKDDGEAIDTLVKIAVHGAYHCGQMNLLKRMARKKS